MGPQDQTLLQSGSDTARRYADRYAASMRLRAFLTVTEPGLQLVGSVADRAAPDSSAAGKDALSPAG